MQITVLTEADIRNIIQDEVTKLLQTQTQKQKTEHTEQVAKVRANDAANLLGVSKSTFLRLVQQGRIPKGMRLTPSITVWRVSDLI